MIVELKVIMADGKSMTIKLNPEEIKKMKELHNVSLLDETYDQIMEELNKK